MQFHRVTTRRKGLYGKLVPAGTLLPGVSTTVRPVNPMLGYESCGMTAMLHSAEPNRRRVKHLFWYDPKSLQGCSEPVSRSLADGLPRLNRLFISAQPEVHSIQSFLLAFPDLTVVNDPVRVFADNYARFRPHEPYRKQLFMCLIAIRSKWILSQLLPSDNADKVSSPNHTPRGGIITSCNPCPLVSPLRADGDSRQPEGSNTVPSRL